jgi:hypothetical protein
VPAKADSSAPLTERERWMLDRMEQLEKRVAELESKNNPPASAAETATIQPAPASPMSPAPVAANVVNPAAAVASMKTQEQASAARPEKAEPFAFADFTWLNGNARTNLLNHPNFAPPTNVTASSLGIVQSVQTAENSGNRTGQLSLRLDF